MRKFYSFGMLFLFLTVCLIGSFAINKPEQTDSGEEASSMLGEKLNQLIENEPKLKGAIAGISVRHASTGDNIYDHMGDVRLRPASNMKLLIAAAALSVLGEDYTFATEVLTDGSVSNDELNGDLFLKGKGDPTLLPEDFDLFAKKVQENGIKVIEGDIVADDTWYDDIRLAPDLVWSDEQWYYGAQISALTASPDGDYDAGTVTVNVQPADPGEKPVVTVSPETAYVQVNNQAETIAADGEDDLSVTREHGGNTIKVEGTIPAGSANVKEWMAVWEPTGYALDLFRQSLENQGITWTGEVRTGQAPETADKLFRHESMPLSELLIPFMKLSNNTHAEMLVKEMGKVVHDEGSWEKGLVVIETTLEKLGVNTDSLTIRDGSGISHMNLIPANEITTLLYAVQEKSWFDTYLNALPAGGTSDRITGGTLRYRMDGQNVMAKTGTIDGVSTLSGYVETAQGDKLIFSIMLNNLLDEEDAPAIEDKMVEMIAREK